MNEGLKVSVIIPVFNEERTVAEVVRRVRELPLRLEIVAVNDCSTDGSARVLDELRLAGQIDVVHHHTRNQGKGAAIRRGVAAASGDVIAVQDADLEYDPADLPRMVSVIESGQADAVFGSRFAGREDRGRYSWQYVGNKLLTSLSNMFTRLSLTDMESGCKVVRSPLMKSLVLRSNRFGFEPEITARLARAGARIHEVAISYRGRTRADGKKVGWRDGIAAVWHIIRFNAFDRRVASITRLRASVDSGRGPDQESAVESQPSPEPSTTDRTASNSLRPGGAL
jgi:glycosyltransferase involved in cell wall biosynthesis